MSDTPFDSMPCPECGGKELIQQIRQSENITVTEDGDYESVEPRDSVDITKLWCTKCDELIWSEN